MNALVLTCTKYGVTASYKGQSVIYRTSLKNGWALYDQRDMDSILNAKSKNIPLVFEGDNIYCSFLKSQISKSEKVFS